ncbi:hypothetical protein COO60DRAFT_761876 [Scenedesmus sp. NREL 46B-D3]|nr:hypothetical protein COO60DRAFT_761876 [Scenedesmus sp. NREL 46B-D3]
MQSTASPRCQSIPVNGLHVCCNSCTRWYVRSVLNMNVLTAALHFRDSSPINPTQRCCALHVVAAAAVCIRQAGMCSNALRAMPSAPPQHARCSGVKMLEISLWTCVVLLVIFHWCLMHFVSPEMVPVRGRCRASCFAEHGELPAGVCCISCKG